MGLLKSDFGKATSLYRNDKNGDLYVLTDKCICKYSQKNQEWSKCAELPKIPKSKKDEAGE
jgi:hypothetical protein